MGILFAGWASKPTRAAAICAQTRIARAAVTDTAALVMEISRAGRAASSAQPACYMRLMTYWNHGNHPAAAGYACVQWAAVKHFIFPKFTLLICAKATTKGRKKKYAKLSTRLMFPNRNIY